MAAIRPESDEVLADPKCGRGCNETRAACQQSEVEAKVPSPRYQIDVRWNAVTGRIVDDPRVPARALPKEQLAVARALAAG
jgi:hypothetical protein